MSSIEGSNPSGLTINNVSTSQVVLQFFMSPAEAIQPSAEVLAGVRARETAIRDRFTQDAKVTNFEKGYVSVYWVNHLVDIGYQGFAADLIVHKFNGTKFDKVVGIPNSGIPLATSVAERLRKPLAPGRKGKDIPGAWRTPIVVEENVASFTTGEASRFVFNGLEPGDNVLIIDDVIAHSDTSRRVVEEFRRHNINAELAVYFAKLFQPGVDRLRDELGIDPFYVIGVSKLTETGVELSPPHF